MKKISFLILLAIFASWTFAQEAKSDAASLELAKETLAAHGGEKLKDVKSIVLGGSVQVSAGSTAQTLPASFAIIVSGEKYRLEIQSMMFNFSQVSDGTQTTSSMPGVLLPPITRVGTQILPFIGNEGFIVSPLGEKYGKKKGFRVTTPEGYYSDFQIDEKTKLVKEYDSSYELNGRLVSTSVAIDKYKEIDGIMINEKFSQRLDLGQMSSYAYFEAKDIKINSAVDDKIFKSAEGN